MSCFGSYTFTNVKVKQRLPRCWPVPNPVKNTFRLAYSPITNNNIALPWTVYGTAVSTEAVLRVSYQPLAVFRVRPVTRCTSTMPGHTEAVLHVSYSPDGSMLASGGGDMTVRLVRPTTCAFAVWALSLSPNSNVELYRSID